MFFELYITSEIEGLLYIDGKIVAKLDKFGKALPIKYDSKEQSVLSIYPIDSTQSVYKKNIPYSIRLKTEENKLICESKNIKLINYGHQIYELIFLPNYIYYAKILLTKNIPYSDSQINITLITNYHSKLKIELKNKTIEFNCKQFLDHFDAYIKNINNRDYLIITSNVENLDYLIFFVIDENNLFKLAEILNDKIELSGEIILCMNKLRDMNKHIIVTKYKILDKKIIKIEKYLSKLDKNNKNSEKIEFIPYIFMENIKVKDYEKAKEYLSEELKNTLTNNHLKKYFGEFVDIKQPLQDHLKSNYVALIYKNQNNYIAKYYKFQFKNNTIYNVDFIE